MRAMRTPDNLEHSFDFLWWLHLLMVRMYSERRVTRHATVPDEEVLNSMLTSAWPNIQTVRTRQESRRAESPKAVAAC
jgi:hypothetical protein